MFLWFSFKIFLNFLKLKKKNCFQHLFEMKWLKLLYTLQVFFRNIHKTFFNLKRDSLQWLKRCKLSLLISVNNKTLFAATKTPVMSNKSWTWSIFQCFSRCLNCRILVASVNPALLNKRTDDVNISE